MSKKLPRMSNRITVLLLLLKMGVLIEADKRKITSTRIIGGQDAALDSHPYMISLRIKFLVWTNHFCGGTLLSENWVLTASHCLEPWIVSLLPMVAIAGGHDMEQTLNPEAQMLHVDRRIIHPKYDSITLVNDIALVNTTTPFTFNKFIKPAFLPYEHSINNSYLTLFGWGTSNFYKNDFFVMPISPNKLQELKVEYLPSYACRKVLENITGPTVIKNSNICSGPFETGACFGDSGGPLVDYVPIGHNKKFKRKGSKRFKKWEKVPVVVGIVSWTLQGCIGPRVYTKVKNYLDFINSYVDQ